MSKYIDKDKVLEYIIFEVVGKDITCGELERAIESLPAIEVSEDCISRQDAIEALSTERTGEWVIKKSHPDDVHEHMWCSECSAFFSVPDFKNIFNYCPNCGAKMGR